MATIDLLLFYRVTSFEKRTLRAEGFQQKGELDSILLFARVTRSLNANSTKEYNRVMAWLTIVYYTAEI